MAVAHRNRGSGRFMYACKWCRVEVVHVLILMPNEAVKKYRRLQILIVLGSTRPHPLSVIARYRPF